MVSIVSSGWRGPGFNSYSFLKEPAGLVSAHSEKEWRVIVTQECCWPHKHSFGTKETLLTESKNSLLESSIEPMVTKS